LELHDSTGQLIASNDDWGTSANLQEIIDSQLSPSNAKESAILITLAPGAYTAIVRGVGNGTGVGLIETYDLDQSVDARLANISTRGFVQTGENVMIGGTIVVGVGPTNVIVRAIGPSLANFGVQDALLDPVLELHDSNGAIIDSNDDWESGGNTAELQANGLAPSHPHESAIFHSLAPGAYTAVVRGYQDGTGVALVEAYQLSN
jgi:hypothetical protein